MPTDSHPGRPVPPGKNEFRLAACVSGICFALISASSVFPPLHPVIWFIALSMVPALLSMLLVHQFTRFDKTIPFAWILITAVLFRVSGVLGLPLFEDDYFRYLWDGYQTLASGDPYSLPPSAFFTDDSVPLVFEEILSAINYPDIATVYGPVNQWIFAAAAWLSSGSVNPLQLVAAIADLCILLLLGSMVSTVASRNCLLLYAWCPLLIKEFALTAHPDVFAICLSLAACKVAQSGESAGYGFVAGCLLGLAIGAKVFAVLLAPFLILRPYAITKSVAASAGLVMAIALLTLSFGSIDIWLPEGLKAMAGSWMFNAPLYHLLIPLAGFSVLKLLLLAGFGLVFFVIWLPTWRNKSKTATESPGLPLMLIYSAFLLMLPVLNPWYWPWILPFAVLSSIKRIYLWPWVGAMVMMLAYWTPFNRGLLTTTAESPHELTTVVIIIEFGLLLLAALFRLKICQSTCQ